MLHHQVFGSPVFDQVALGTIELHRLIREGKGDDAEADEIRDSLDGPIAALTTEERTRAQLLSADLYSISKVRGDHEQLPMNPQARAKLRAVVEARDARQWDKALALLRRWERYVSLEFVSFQRGMIWDRAGKAEIAVAFYRHAAEINPESFMPGIFIATLARVDAAQAAAEAWRVLNARSRFPAAVQVQAAYVVLVAACPESNQLMPSPENILIPMLEKALEEFERNGSSIEGAIDMAALLLGVAYQRLGNLGSAQEAFSRGLRVHPRSVPLLTLRGLLMYGTSDDAISDFLAASHLPAETAWPSFCLAHHYLLANDFAGCREMCIKALKLAHTGSLASKATEWLAISEAELGFPREAVRRRFEQAILLDPENEVARANMAVFDASSQGSAASVASWNRPSDSTVREQGLRSFHPHMGLRVPYDLAA